LKEVIVRLGALCATAAATVFGLAAPAAADNPTLNLTTLSFEQASVDATGGTATATLNWTVTDTSTKATTIWGSVDIRQVGDNPGDFVGPTYSVSFGTSWDGTIQVLASSGNAQRSTYTYRFPVPQYTGAAKVKWAVAQVKFHDDASHSRTLDASDLTRFHAQFDAADLVDSTAPTYDTLSVAPFTPDAVYVADKSATVTYEFTVTDSESGFFRGEIVLTGPGGAQIKTPFQVVTQDGLPTCGTDENGDTHWMLCDIGVTIPQGTTAGVWTVTSIGLTDVVGNHKAYGNLSLAPVVVTENAVLRATDFALNPGQVNNWASGQTVKVIMRPIGGSGTVASVSTVSSCGGEYRNAPVTDEGDGTFSTPLYIPIRTASCSVTGIELTDTAGNSALYGSYFGAPALDLTATQIPDTTPPVATAASLSATSFPTSDTPRNLGVYVDVQSAVGVSQLSVTVYSASGASVTGSYGGVTQTTNGTIEETVSLPQLAPGTYTVGFTITDAGGLYTLYGYPGFPTPTFGQLQFTVTA
jgi:hypothetical protein